MTVACSYRYAPVVMMDGNMKADHQRPKYGLRDAPLGEGAGFFVRSDSVQEYKAQVVVRKVSLGRLAPYPP